MRKFLPSMCKFQQGVGVFKKRSERAERKGQHVRNAEGMFYKLVLMENLYLGLTWPILQFSLASCCISKTHIARYARL